MRCTLRILGTGLILSAVVGPTAVANDLEIVELASGVWAALQPRESRFNDSNSVLLVGERGALVVDCQASPATARALVAELRKRTDAPVRYLVLTHWHGDHTRSAAVWKDAWPGLEIVAHRSLLEDIPGRTVPAIAEEAQRYEQGIARAEGWLRDEVGPDGEPLTDELRARMERELAAARSRLAELEQLEVPLPTLAYDERLTLDLGGRVVELMHQRAHTRGDTVLWLPRDGILVTGDLLDELPYAGHGYPASWLETLEGLDALEARWTVPGHGGLLEGESQLRRVHGLIADVLRQARATEAPSLEAFVETLDVARHRAILAGDDEIAGRNFDGFLPGLAERCWLETRGELD